MQPRNEMEVIVLFTKLEIELLDLLDEDIKDR